MLHSPFYQQDATKNITTKFKNLRKILKQWKQSLSNMHENIQNVKLLLSFMNFFKNADIFLYWVEF
jgi:hypothetical protein